MILRIEEKLTTGNARDARRGPNKMMGSQQKPASQCDHPLSLSTSRSSFYTRFDKQDFSDECEVVCTGMTSCPVIVEESEVTSLFRRVKAPGPGGLTGKFSRNVHLKRSNTTSLG